MGPRPYLTRLAAALSLAFACALAAGPAFADAGSPSTWKLGYYTPSGRALSMASAPSDGATLASFDFTSQDNTALLVTTHGADKGSLLGNLNGDQVTAGYTIAGATGAFTYYGQGQPGSCGTTPASVRFFFITDNGGGFDPTHYWWSNPISHPLANGSFTLTAPVSPAAWSDWNGHLGINEATGFKAAAANVTMIGLSFGGGCYFENGVGTTDGTGTFTLSDFSVSP